MSYITSVGTGTWSTATTWSGGVVPVSGDTVTVSHTVTVTSIETVGDSPTSNTTALDTTATGKIVINPGASLTVRGDLNCLGPGTSHWTALTLEGGGQLWMDNSQSASSVKYLIRLGRSANQRVGLETRGSVSSICTIGSVAGGSPSFFSRNGIGGTQYYRCSYTDFLRIGDNASTCLYLYLNQSSSEATFDHCVFDNCGQFEMNTITGSGATLSVAYSIWTNTAATQCMKILWSAGTIRNVEENSFDTQVTIQGGSGGTIQRNFFARTIAASGSASYDFSANMVRQTVATTGHATHASVFSNYYLSHTATGNCHMISPTNSAGGDVYIQGNIFEYTGTPSNGDMVLGLTGLAAGTNYRVNRNLVIPNGAGDSSGAINFNGGSNATLFAEYNTFMAGGSGGIYVGETYGRANLVLSVRGNLMWDTSARGYKIWRETSNILQDIVSGGSVDFNSGWSFATGTDLKGYQGSAATHLCSVAPGANDLNVNPNFVDSSRNITTWAASLGLASSSTSGVEAIFNRYGRSGANASATPQNLYDYVANGFRPTNTSLRSASHESLTIGAFEGVFAGASALYPIPRIDGRRGGRVGTLHVR